MPSPQLGVLLFRGLPLLQSELPSLLSMAAVVEFPAQASRAAVSSSPGLLPPFSMDAAPLWFLVAGHLRCSHVKSLEKLVEKKVKFNVP
ncbi:hypothetical protein Zm00014a_021601 [Zea mays]|uniref:Uncharacterized protein n=1 Tax=Zea mays TaxID=4577 RepID=A0A3L6FBM7_MAIZE|nr:hypothetical protein Zm00014a_021601 [Zea mays]